MLLEGKVAVITGGSRGIGRAIAEKFLENGARVVIFGSREETVNRALEEMKSEHADWPVTGSWPELTRAEEVEKAVREVKDRYGRLDIMVNNAGVSDSTPTLKVEAEHFAEIIDLNINAVFYGMQAAAKMMKEQGYGTIISTSSMVSKNGQPSGIAYPSSKYAVNGLTVSLARELGPMGIRVNAVAPGVVNTDMVKVLPKEMIQPIIDHIPLRRVAEPEDIANAFLYLASDLSSYVNGEVLHVDGGMMV